MFCVTAVPASAAGSDYVIGLFGMSDNGVFRAIGFYEDFEQAWNNTIYYATNLDKAWNDAMPLEENDKMEEGGFVCLRVEVFGDWNADSNGMFGSGIGFKDGAIYVPGGTKINVELLGFSINSGKADGTAIYIDADADFEINRGTVIGGIYADDNAKVSTWNVYVTGNTVKNDSEYAHSASIFSKGSLTMIVEVTALIASVSAIWVSVSSKKNKAAVSKKESEGEE